MFQVSVKAGSAVVIRDDNGPLISRALKNVPKLGGKTFEQAAGFLRIPQGEEPLDATAIHPESYAIARVALQRANIQPEMSLVEQRRALALMRHEIGLPKLAEELG